MFNTARLLLVALTALTVAACDTIPVREQPEDVAEPVEQPGGVELIPLEDYRQESAFDVADEPEDLAAAIEEDLRRARTSSPPIRQASYLDAADKLVHAGRLEDAEFVLNNTDVNGLGPALALRKHLVSAEIHFQRGNFDRASRDAARTLRGGSIDPAYIARALDIKARVDLRQGRPLEAARGWIRRDDYLADSRLLGENRQRVWYAIGRLNQLELQLAGQDNFDNALRGWLDLAILFLESGADRDGLRRAVASWRDANPSHPAAGFASTLLGPARSPEVRQIGLLLPLSSEFSTAAQRVYNGFDAAHGIDTHPRRPGVVFYDIGGEASLVGNYVGVAQAEGADVVVGPLGKAAVSELLQSRQIERPMVLLGSTDTASSSARRAYQFDLAPETEARQVAEFMYTSGHRRAVALYPNDDLGQRVYRAFVSRWEELGGTLAEGREYQPGADDFTAPIKELFNLPAGETRKALLENSSGLRLQFEARRRRDIDSLFMVARPDKARLLKPQINFFRGHDLPVYSTSHVYTGTPDAARDTDLDGIRFPAMPWLLRDTGRMNNLRSALRDAGNSNISTELFALGFDAYQIALIAPDAGLADGTRMSGLTSELILGGDGRVHRRFDWAEFSDGVPVRIWQD